MVAVMVTVAMRIIFRPGPEGLGSSVTAWVGERRWWRRWWFVWWGGWAVGVLEGGMIGTGGRAEMEMARMGLVAWVVDAVGGSHAMAEGGVVGGVGGEGGDVEWGMDRRVSW